MPVATAHCHSARKGCAAAAMLRAVGSSDGGAAPKSGVAASLPAATPSFSVAGAETDGEAPKDFSGAAKEFGGAAI